MTDAELERWRGNIESRLAALERLDASSGSELRERGAEIRAQLKALNETVEALGKQQAISAALNRRTGTQVRWLIAGLTVAIAVAGFLSKVL
jgi:hypothetical protein